jgi:hypothetical protein
MSCVLDANNERGSRPPALRGKVRRIQGRARNDRADRKCLLFPNRYSVFDHESRLLDCCSQTAGISGQLHRGSRKAICGGGGRGRTNELAAGNKNFLTSHRTQYGVNNYLLRSTSVATWAWTNISRRRPRHRSGFTITLRSSAYPINTIPAAADHPRCWAACLLPSLRHSLI